MAAAAIPALVKVGSVVGGSLLGKKLGGANKQQQAGMDATQGALGPLQGASSSLLQSGGQLSRQGSGYLQQAGDYYGKLLGAGSRGELRSQLSPEINSVMDYYKGASGKANRTLRGGSRDYATAELDRQKVGNTASLVAGARTNAAQGAADVGGAMSAYGTQQSGQGMYGLGTGALVANQLYNQGTQQNEQQGAAGKVVGGLIYDVISGTWKKAAPAGPKLGGLYGAVPQTPGGNGNVGSYASSIKAPSPGSVLSSKQLTF